MSELSPAGAITLPTEPGRGRFKITERLPLTLLVVSWALIAAAAANIAFNGVRLIGFDAARYVAGIHTIEAQRHQPRLSNVIAMTATPRSPRNRVALPIVGAALVAGVVIVATRALRFLYFGPGGVDVVRVPRDAVEPFGIVFVTSSVVAGSLLLLAGAVLIAGWLGYRAALRR